MVKLNNVSIVYGKKSNKRTVLDNLSLNIDQGDFITVVGRSGCGKTTLLNVIGGILKPTSGEVVFDGINVYGQNDTGLAKYRNENIGFVVQHFALIKQKTVMENIALPLKYRNISGSDVRQKVSEIADMLEISHLLRKRPYEISGGECQRTAIGRALVADPKLIIADEPTGALDETTGDSIMDIMQQINKNGKTILMVTHDTDYANIGTRKLLMSDGAILDADS